MTEDSGLRYPRWENGRIIFACLPRLPRCCFFRSLETPTCFCIILWFARSLFWVSLIWEECYLPWFCLGTAWLGLAVCNFYEVKTDFTHLGLAFLASDQTHTQKNLTFLALNLLWYDFPCLVFPSVAWCLPPPFPLLQHLPACLLALSLFIPLCVFPLISPPSLSPYPLMLSLCSLSHSCYASPTVWSHSC